LGTLRNVIPSQWRIQVFTEANVVRRVGDAKGKIARNPLPIGKSGAGQFH
jgi:hypothetical protein